MRCAPMSKQASTQNPVSDERLLINRREAARLLGKSVATIARLERAGVLTPIKINPKKAATVSLRLSEVRALAEGKPAS